METAVLRARLEAPLLGVPLVIRSNTTAVIAAAEQAFRLWLRLPPTLVAATEPGVVEVIEQAAAVGEVTPLLAVPPVTRTHDGTLLVVGEGCLAYARPATGHALAFVTPEVVADPLRVRAVALERLGLALACAHGRTPIRAGAVGWNGYGIIFVGSGSLPALLAIACARAGFTLLAAETSYLSTEPTPTLWGHAVTLRLPIGAARWFPEVESLSEGKVIDATLLGIEHLTTHLRRAALCLVETYAGQASLLEPMQREGALAALADLGDAGMQRGLAALTRRQMYRLQVGADWRNAVALIRHLAEQQGL